MEGSLSGFYHSPEGAIIMVEAILDISHYQKRYGGNTIAVRDLSLTV